MEKITRKDKELICKVGVMTSIIAIAESLIGGLWGLIGVMFYLVIDDQLRQRAYARELPNRSAWWAWKNNPAIDSSILWAAMLPATIIGVIIGHYAMLFVM